MTKLLSDTQFLFAAANAQEPNVADLPSLFFFSILGLLCIGYIIWRLSDTSKDTAFFRFFFPPRRQRTQPWGIPTIVFAVFLVLWCAIMAQGVVQLALPGKIAFLNDTEAVDNNTSAVDNLEPDEAPAQPMFTKEKLSEQHSLTILMQKADRHPSVIVLCFLAVVIVAPLSEELFFRVLTQGGIEAAIRRNPNLRGSAKKMAIVLTALFFAAIHFRFPQKGIDDQFFEFLFKAFLAKIVGDLSAIAIMILVLRKWHRIRWSDIGFWDFKRLPRDIAGAFLLFLTIFLPISVIHSLVRVLFECIDVPASMADPVPLFLFALVLGTLYSRTRRFASVFFLHAFFNLYSFLFLLYMTFNPISATLTSFGKF